RHRHLGAGTGAERGALRALRFARRVRLRQPPALGHAQRIRRTPRGHQEVTAQPRSDALVLFGATGDLANKMLYPALQALVKREHFDMPVIGVSRSEWSDQQLRERAHDSLQRNHSLDRAAFEKLAGRLHYVSGDYQDPATFDKLQKALGAAKHPLYYLAIPPSTFPEVVKGLGTIKATRGARVVAEKPFGRDLATARDLNRVLHGVFEEDSILRIDHYLGKETVL